MCVECDNKVEQYLGELDEANGVYFDRNMQCSLKAFKEFLELLEIANDSNFTSDFFSQGFKEALTASLKVLERMAEENLIEVATSELSCSGLCGKDFYLQLDSGMFLRDIIPAHKTNAKREYIFSSEGFYRCRHDQAIEALKLFGGKICKI
jgi:hypothetical protein